MENEQQTTESNPSEALESLSISSGSQNHDQASGSVTQSDRMELEQKVPDC
ncbi:unnamed protein product [Rhodiola kirilowii]